MIYCGLLGMKGVEILFVFVVDFGDLCFYILVDWLFDFCLFEVIEIVVVGLFVEIIELSVGGELGMFVV